MLNRPFGPGDIVDLARNPAKDLAARPPGGFSFPQRGWVYRAAEAFYRSGRSESALWTAFEAQVTGQKMTDWKRTKGQELTPRLQRFVGLDRQSRAAFVESAYVYPSSVVTWREHALRLPLGLIVEEEGQRGLRLLWIESMFQPRKRGAILVASATLAAAEVARGTFRWVETWHLNAGEAVRFAADDLRASWTRLDRMLGEGEERAGRSA
jgi:hypothetical protein